ncbi:MAG: homoserine dehydrogenase [Candidatus Abyssobacteria bacterium SURF_5]|uniref:Homoserine dehydrogenase n=1 Tax=Abyssobacteria bacterium (strain SURF_5) TaxID=2093360 RepID=A0A3A4P8B5_ABYX5|nr:MAG: homoserine dehydrogenase [Candidatus Abyssubacteria bacterium SURF_5]
MKEVGVGIIGLGVVGSGVYETLVRHSDEIARRTGIKLVIRKAADLDQSLRQRLGIPDGIFTTDAGELIKNDSVDVVVELIGGYSPAGDFIIESLNRKKHVVTANKALLAKQGAELVELAARNEVDLCFEASVAGGIPILKALREGLVANNIDYIYGIVNGTCNYILTRMTSEQMGFERALKEAQKKGFAEADPTLDIEGYDSAHKLAILASIAFNSRIDLADVHVEGISGITLEDVAHAEEFGYVIKLLAIAKLAGEQIEVRVHPTLVPKDSLLASIRDEYNGLLVHGDVVGTTMYYGKGAGKFPTSSAIISDLVDIGKNMSFKSPVRTQPFTYANNLSVKNIEDITSLYYIRFTALDNPGVLGQVSGVLGKHGISIASVIQKVQHRGKRVPVVMMTHEAVERDVRRALSEIDKLDSIEAKSALIRIIS